MTELIAQNSLLRFCLLAGLFALVVAAAFVISSAFAQRQQLRTRLARNAVSNAASRASAGSLRPLDNAGAWVRLVNAIEKSGLSLIDTQNDVLRQRMIAAGYRQPLAPRVFTLIRLMLGFGLPLLVFLMVEIGGSTPSLLRLYIILTIAAVLGLYFPSLFIKAKADRRQQALIDAFPDALDLMLVCVEAGLGLEAAFARVGQEMTTSHPLLADLLGTVVLELRAGRSREDALRRMADRAGADEIRAFSTLLIQSTKLGSSIAQSLRIYATEMRERRRMRAEEKAHRLPVLLSIPLITCMLPVMIGVLMLPAGIRIVRVLIPAFHGVN